MLHLRILKDGVMRGLGHFPYVFYLWSYTVTTVLASARDSTPTGPTGQGRSGNSNVGGTSGRPDGKSADHAYRPIDHLHLRTRQ